MYAILGIDVDSAPPSSETTLTYVHPDDREAYSEARNRAALSNSDVFEFRIIRPDGEERVLRRELDAHIGDDGRPTRIFGTVHDISQRVVAEARERELERQLLHSQKLEALGTLAGGIAHDLNNTLVPIQALSKLVMQEIPEDAPVRIDLETIHQASLQARDLVRQILAFSRKQEMIATPTDIALRMREALQMLRASVPSTIEIVENIAPIAAISGDGTQLQQIVVNLVTNGAYAIGDNFGRVIVTLEEPASEPDMPRTIVLKVADTGCGMSPEIVHRMFEPFFTTKSVGEGTGLGLSVVHGIVTSLGGTIDVKSVPGEGTEFTVTLPVKSVDKSMDMAAVA
jgi:signal transduction histidine kinase